MQVPPLLPEETLTRVLRLARFDGLGVLVLGGGFALLAAAGGDKALAAVGLAAAGAGAVELHGVTLLRQGAFRGLRWIIASQPLLLAAVWVYCALRLTHFALPPLPEELRAAVAETARELGMAPDDYLRLVHRITHGLVALLATAYQGGLGWYYWRRREPVRRALEPEA
ncbi:MAG: hypothetical protein ACO3G4_08930 [Opitutaceae bacterium]